MKKLLIACLFITSCASHEMTSEDAYKMAVSSMSELNVMQRHIDSIIKNEDPVQRSFDSLDSRKVKRDMQLKVVELFIKSVNPGKEKSELIERYKKAVDDANDYEYAPAAAPVTDTTN